MVQTGSREEWCANNIYDFAGNVDEWTQEQNKSSYRVIRGGDYYKFGDDYPYPSCLILGYNTNNKIIHIVCGVSEDTVHMVTAYYPNTHKWEEDMKTRREK